MKEQIRSNADYLTTPSQNPHTRVGEIFMAENGEGQEPSKGIAGPVEELRRQWHSVFTPEELKNPDTRSTIEAAIGLGYGPQKVTSKGPSKIEAREVIANALLGDEERIARAEKLLQQTLSPQQEAALLKAHYEGRGEKGKEDRGAGVYSYTLEQLLRKARILKHVGGFSEAQIRTIIESGLAATPITYTYPPLLQGIVDEMNSEVARVGAGNPPDAVFTQNIQDAARRVRDLRDANAANPVIVNETNRLLGTLNAWMAESMAAAGEERRTSYFSSREVSLIRTDPKERERIFEEIFIGVDANPGKQFERAQSLQDATNFSDFFRILNEAEIKDSSGNVITDPIVLLREREKLLREFSARGEIRAILHNANWSVSGGGDIQSFASAVATYQAEYTDLIFNDPLVETALHMFEQAFQKIKADNNGMLPYEKLEWNYKTKSSGLEDIVWDQMIKALVKGVVKEKVIDEHGNIRMRPINEGEEIPTWRLRRAITLARGFGVLSLRFPEIAAEARLPEERPGISAEERAKRLASIYGEAIARYFDPLEHAIEKFRIGGPERALLYFFLTGKKGQFQSTKQIREALEMQSHLTGEDKRLIDIINIFRTGGPFTYTSWRLFTAMEGMTQDQLLRSGIGIREARVSGDVDDAILEEVRTDTAWRGRSEEDVAAEAERRSSRVMPGEEHVTYKEHLILQRRLAMWDDALKVNPLRAMWILESREPGQRLSFLSGALKTPDISEEQAREEARQHLDEVENNLMVVQEGFVSSRRSIEDQGEMLDFNIIEDVHQRDRAIRYVAKIREKGMEKNYQLIRPLFENTPSGDSPFPFIIGMEDIPFSDFDFIKAGGRAFARRITDLAGAITASNELIGLITKFPTSQNIGPLIESLVKIKAAVSDYDRDVAMKILPLLEEGILRAYDKEVLARLPLGIGTVVGLFKDTSYAQEVLGRTAMSWDEGDKYSFTRQLLQNGLIEKNKLGDFRKRVGATVWHAGIDMFRTYGQLILLILAFEFANRVVKDK